jgi:hypothetical protein
MEQNLHAAPASGRTRGRRSSRTRGLGRLAVTGAIVIGALGFQGSGAGAMSAPIHVTATVNIRPGATTASGNPLGTIPQGASPDFHCWAQGQNISGVDVWFNVTWSGITGYYASYYDDSSYATDAQITTKYGIPQCGSSTPAPPAPTPPPPAPAPSNAVWIGSPVNGMWAWFASSLPANHPISYGGDWSVDLPTASGQDVNLYAAPQYSSLAVTTVVEKVAPACRSGLISDGGYQVVVGIYNGSTKIGKAIYAHINPTVSVGQTIPRWGTRLGTIGSYTHNANGCWDGEHVHFELYSQKNYACFNKGYALQQAVYRTNFIGYTGGNFANHQRAACP